MKRGLPLIPADRIIAPAAPRPDEGVVSWNMNTTCNYRCSYCTQRFLDDRQRWARDVPAFLAAFGALPDQTGVPWEIKLSGGEPFLHPGFVDVVRGLAERNLFISVVTNFSRIDKAGADDDDVTAHLQVCCQGPQASLVVTCVASQQNLNRLQDLQQSFAEVGVRFKVQPEKQDREIVAYDDDGVALLRLLGGHNGTGHIAHDYGGQPCWAGARYFIVDDLGEAFRCYPARRYRVERLGNVVDGTLRLQDAAAPCRYRSCNCTVPIARGMMPTSAVIDRFE